MSVVAAASTTFEAADGWPISGLLRPPSEAGSS